MTPQGQVVLGSSRTWVMQGLRVSEKLPPPHTKPSWPTLDQELLTDVALSNFSTTTRGLITPILQMRKLDK